MTKIHLHENVDEVSVPGTPSTGEVLYWNGSKWVNDSGPIEQKVIAIVIPNSLSTGVKAPRIYFPFSSGSMKFTRIIGGVAVAPVGSSLSFTVRRSTLTVGSVSITAGNYVGSTDSLTQLYWAAGHYLDVNITAVGSTTPGSDLTVQLVGDGIGLTKARVT